MTWSKTPSKNFMPWLVWGLAAGFYLYELVLRILPGVIVPELMKEFSISALGIGGLSAFFYYAYTPLQLPVGILTDRYGARALLTMSCLLCAVGTYIFAIAPSYGFVLCGRFLVGLGSAFAWVGVIYLIAHWFDASRMGLLIGLASSLGLIGGICGQGPMAYLARSVGWREANVLLAWVGLALALLIFLFVRNDPRPPRIQTSKETSLATVLGGFKGVLRNSQSWIVAAYSTTIYLCISVFSELWGISYLQAAYGLSREIAGYAISLIYLGFLIGGPTFGIVSDHFEKRKPVVMIGALLACIFMSIVIFIPQLPLVILFAALICFGMAASTQLLSFSIAIEINPLFAKGSALAFNNFFTMVGGSIMQPLVGYLLMRGAGGQVSNFASYCANDFRSALIILPLSCLLGFFLTFLIKETHCKQFDGKKHLFESYAD
jgi:MFS family permease